MLWRRFHLVTNPMSRKKQELAYDGPYLIKRMLKPSVAEIEGLPEGIPKHINVQFLRKYVRLPECESLRSIAPPPPPVIQGSDVSWEIEEILNHRGEGRRQEFLIAWKGYPNPTWTKKSYLTGCEQALKDYWRQHRRVAHN